MRRISLLLSLIPLPLWGGQHWREIDDGLQVLRLNNGITALRIDPQLWQFHAYSHQDIAELQDKRLTAKQWSKKFGLAAAINAGMYDTDYQSHVGYFAVRDRVIIAKWNHYKSVAAFGPKKPGLAPFRLFDIHTGYNKSRITGDYANVIQNLRLIKHPRSNRWQHKKKAWREAALAQDHQGRVLFIYSARAYPMSKFNRLIGESPINATVAQHLEGGAQAQLYVGTNGYYKEWSGSGKLLGGAWPLPNVIGIKKLKQ